MLRKLLLIALVGASVQATAQTNFRPGYVVLPAGDTLRGEVDARGAIRNARLARFRTAADAAIVEYQPQQLRGYGIVGAKTYATQLIDSVAGKQDLTLFVEQLVAGRAKLLLLRDETGLDHFYLKMLDGPAQELTQQTQSLIGEDGKRHMIYTNTYLTTLAQAFQQCPSLLPRIAATKFALFPLVKVVSAYNTCTDSDSSTEASPVLNQYRSKTRVSIIGGVQRSQLKINDEAFDAGYFNVRRITAKASGNIQPVLGIGVIIPVPLISERVALRLEALYSRQKFEAEAPDNKGRSIQYTVKESVFYVPVMLRYTAPSHKIQPYIQAGAVPLFASTYDNTVQRPTLVGQGYEDKKQFVDNESFDLGLTAALGVTIAAENKHQWGVEVRGARAGGFSAVTTKSMPTNRFFLLLSYDLTK